MTISKKHIVPLVFAGLVMFTGIFIAKQFKLQINETVENAEEVEYINNNFIEGIVNANYDNSIHNTVLKYHHDTFLYTIIKEVRHNEKMCHIVDYTYATNPDYTTIRNTYIFKEFEDGIKCIEATMSSNNETKIRRDCDVFEREKLLIKLNLHTITKEWFYNTIYEKTSTGYTQQGYINKEYVQELIEFLPKYESTADVCIRFEANYDLYFNLADITFMTYITIMDNCAVQKYEHKISLLDIIPLNEIVTY